MNHSQSTPTPTPSLAITWQQPTFLLPLFGLCCLLGVSNSLAAALSLALLMNIAVLSMTALIPLLLRLAEPRALTVAWLALSALLIAALELLVCATLFELFLALGIFLPLAAATCLVLVRDEMLRADVSPPARWLIRWKRALRMCGGFMLAAAVLGAGREWVGHGSLFHDAPQLWGNWATPLAIQFFTPDLGFLLAVLAPGAFIGLGLGVALYNWVWLRMKRSGTV